MSASILNRYHKQPEESNLKYHSRRLITTKSLEDIENDQGHSGLKRALSAFDLTMIGLGNVIGSGIFVLTGEAAATKAGPAVVISFIISGVAAAFAALSYSELASMIPVSGSAYTYVYATMGELMAWIIGWDLILEYLVGWSGYFAYFFSNAFNIEFSDSWTNAPITFNDTTGVFESVPGAYFNVPAFAISIILTILLIVGIKESATVNTVIVSIKVFIIIIFVIAAGTKVNPENYKPFVPPNEGSFSKFGFTGVLSAASVVFFSYIGFDAVSTTSQEAKNPQRDLPIGIIGSLLISTILYIAVCLVLTGVVSYHELDSSAPIAVAVSATGMRWLGIIVDLGALAGLTSVILTSLMGQPRIFYSMANDGLFPKIAAKVHPKFKTPYITTATTGIICAIASAILPIEVLSELTSVGTLLAFFLVNIGVMILRITAPDAPRKFKVPGGPYFVPIVGALLSLLLLSTATVASIERLFIWMAVGLIIYAFYGRRRSKANNSRIYEEDEKSIDRSRAINDGQVVVNDEKGIEIINIES
ncbi:amino acid permease-domain-containing protein [Glomus cerebriforme]|uniref:Amino acid permease-domain-containing protein n=1 Tax=Glomus cerebriforme TaxID=658196 RepID=A0A397SDS7_9GLOM|nr:amino acid permease-domain-containing protein [Glomus cerebriforme]